MYKCFFISAIALLTTFPVRAEQITLNPGARVSAAVSNTNPNYLRVNDDRILSVQAAKGVLSDKSPTPEGAIVFSTLTDKPFTMFVQTASGFAFSVQATPGKRAGLSLTVDNLEVRGTHEAQEYEQKQDTYSALISSLIGRFITNRKPAGYVFSKNTDIPVSKAVKSVFALRPVTAWQGDRIRIVRTDLTSLSSQRIQLSERYFWSPGVMAVSFHPRLDVLEPGKSVSLITVFRTTGGADEP
ncbi:TraK domain-containing protein [Mixta intestinalis]|uniref:Type-F conjugative transfer system secretin TraK n=1 Tax=Mixta intestinalis TaxID=1615494 RepID=A0A6P1Q4Q8_9GAMM|nr:type-F conjugative transfer system secretin TraK [Mixta intestinalis]QHM74030.1 hypothetical protein C7M51_04391 [Mixta intestinalis]